MTKNNTGHSNTGDWNTGYRNTGNSNTGDWNTGYRNTGDWNTGYRNTGNRNTGDWNTGDWNTGDWNTGDWNTGYRNTGYRNTGNRNTGNWNICDKETGFFNTVQSNVIRVFNQECSIKDWEDCDKPNFIYFNLTEWVIDSDMTDQEKKDNKTFHTTGGYLKSYEYQEAFQKSWGEADEEDKKKVLGLPNFDSAIFKKISGIDVDAYFKVEKTCEGKVVEIDGVKYRIVKI